MNTITGIILGIIQGLTEFLPISSSGHLVLFQNLLGLREPELLFDSALHLGTLVAVCVYFRSDLKKMINETSKYLMDLFQGRESLKRIEEVSHAALTLWVLVGTIPTALIGFAFRLSFEKLFGSLFWVGMMLIFTGLILAATRLIPKGHARRPGVGLLAALAVGTAHGIGPSGDPVEVLAGLTGPAGRLRGATGTRLSVLAGISMKRALHSPLHR